MNDESNVAATDPGATSAQKRSGERAKKVKRKRAHPRLEVSNFGPITHADVTFGDLTVIVGPQATGKSLLLQTLKLLVDREHVHDTFKHHNMGFAGKPDGFMDAYFGRGMQGAVDRKTSVVWGGKTLNLHDYAKPSKSTLRYERVFYIPAQRVMSLPGGISQNFGQFNFGDPYSLRAFSDAVHDLIQNEFGAKGELFPASNRLNEDLRAPISEHLFGGSRLMIDEADYTKKLALKVDGQKQALGFLSLSAGQREFIPMLLGLYWLCTPQPRRKTGHSKEEAIEWVVLEEPEMGLHPQAISAVLLLVLELLRRDYRVVISTHSPVVLEMVWALQEFKSLEADESSVRELFGLTASNKAKALGKAALEKDYRVYFLGRTSSATEISHLNPGADNEQEASWGGITGFSNKTNSAIAKAVNKAEARTKRVSRKAATNEERR
ncbi:AAA family ATPase [Comamonas sp. UBA7528]|uniref:AAA family ATPase n=1 Tax=Comamonas sp. UBA7528 TaxID=1946391 RepID=UPI0025B93000|nr:AAA family ATPase [Comamonas sp. UBA7528]